MNNINNNLTIWCMYHNDNIIDDYNLHQLPSYYKLLNLNDLQMDGDNINYLNPFLCELCGYYYVWKNNIKSNYVGFCHYRRLYLDLKLEMLEKYGYTYYSTFLGIIKDNFGNDGTVKNRFYDLYKYLESLNIFDNDNLHDIFYSNVDLLGPWKISCILKWEHFVHICELVFGFLEYIMPDYRNENIYDNGRMTAFEFEIFFYIIVGIYFNNINVYNDDPLMPNKILVLNDGNHNKNDINTFIRKNTKCGVPIYLLDKKILHEDIYFVENVSIVNNVNEIECNEEQKCIYLSINEYIDTLDPIHFYNNNYTIKTIN